jgi:outer membrane protein assembly factor BamD
MIKILRLATFLILALFLASCSGTKVKPQISAQQHIQKAETLQQEERYDEAIASWESVRDSFYSPELSMLAEFKIAELYYTADRFDEAAIAFEAYIKQYPQDSRRPELLFKQGMSHYNQILEVDRDQTSTSNAMRIFEQLNRQFPESQHAAEADNLILRCKTRLADHEVYIGWFYLKTKKYQPAINRLENVLSSFPDYHYRDEAYLHLIKAYIESGAFEKAQTTYKQLADQFPHSEQTEDAKELLEKVS